MKTLCNCTKKWDICTHCYMANLEDWSHIHAIAMSAEADRRLQEDLRFLESVNVWHLVNLRGPNPHALYASTTYADTLDVISPSMTQLGAYSQNSYLSPSYLEGHKYFTVNTSPEGENGANFHHNRGISTPPISGGIGTSLPYPDLILHAHAKDVLPRQISQRTVAEDTNNEKQYEELLESLPKSKNIVESRDFSPVIQNSLPLKETPRLKHLSLLPREPEDYDTEETSHDCATPDGKKSVTFTSDTVFVERDMDSPFWMAFSERRRQRRIHKQRKQLNAQIASVTYQPSLLEIVKSAFSMSPSRDSNGNNTSKKKRHHHHQNKKGEVLVYDNSSQIPETYTAQYIYSVPPSRSHKLRQIFTCQCCSSPLDPTV